MKPENRGTGDATGVQPLTQEERTSAYFAKTGRKDEKHSWENQETGFAKNAISSTKMRNYSAEEHAEQNKEDR